MFGGREDYRWRYYMGMQLSTEGESLMAWMVADLRRGVDVLAGLEPGEATVLGSMSKALGAGGGFLAGRRELVELFRRSPETSGSAIPQLPVAGAALAALRIIGGGTGRITHHQE